MTATDPGVSGAGSGPTGAAGDTVLDWLVLGAGVSGLVAASILSGQGNVVVVDEYAQVGGNHLDLRAGDYTFDVGSLIFQDDSPLLQHFPELLERYEPIEPTWSRLNPQAVVTDYPFSMRDDIVSAGPLEWARILASLLVGRLHRRHPRNARDFAEFWLGRRFVERSGLAYYMTRFCGRPIEEIDLEFARSRMQWISEQARPGLVLRRLIPASGRTPPPRANRQLARPRAGFAALYEPAQRRLQAEGVRFRLGAVPQSLTRRPDGRFELRVGGTTLVAERVLSTIPLDLATALCGLEVPALPGVVLITLCFSFDGQRNFATSVLYNFSHGGSWKRLTVYSDFYGRCRGREFFAVEVVRDDVAHDVDSAEVDFRRHVAANRLLDGDLLLEASHVLDHAYPVYTEGSADRAADAVAALRDLGVESFGRQGGFRYQPTARVSTQEAESTLAEVTKST